MLPRKAGEVLEAAYIEGLSAMLSEVRFDLCQRIGVDQQTIRSQANKFAGSKQQGEEAREGPRVNL
jgi:hypothetical protein